MVDGFVGAAGLVVELRMVGWLAKWRGIKSPLKSLFYRFRPFCRIAVFQSWYPSDQNCCSNTDGLINEIDHDTMKASIIVFTLLSITARVAALSDQYDTESFLLHSLPVLFLLRTD